jgi:hypothetical protein
LRTTAGFFTQEALSRFPIRDRQIVDAAQAQFACRLKRTVGTIFVGIHAADFEAFMILAKIIRRNLIEAAPHAIDARPACFVFGQPAGPHPVGEQPDDLARRMRLNFVMRQVIGAAHELGSKILRHRLHERRTAGPAQRRNKLCEQVRVVERIQDSARVRVAEGMSEQDHLAARFIASR